MPVTNWMESPTGSNRADATRPASLSAASEPSTMPATMGTNITAYCVDDAVARRIELPVRSTDQLARRIDPQLQPARRLFLDFVAPRRHRFLKRVVRRQEVRHLQLGGLAAAEREVISAQAPAGANARRDKAIVRVSSRVCSPADLVPAADAVPVSSQVQDSLGVVERDVGTDVFRQRDVVHEAAGFLGRFERIVA
jgi:hypothetical protein